MSKGQQGKFLLGGAHLYKSDYHLNNAIFVACNRELVEEYLVIILG